jgi:hypothetical protein
MKSDLLAVESWLKIHNLTLSITKTKFIVFKRKNPSLESCFNSLECNGNIIYSVQSYEYLGYC